MDQKKVSNPSKLDYLGLIDGDYGVWIWPLLDPEEIWRIPSHHLPSNSLAHHDLVVRASNFERLLQAVLVSCHICHGQHMGFVAWSVPLCETLLNPYSWIDDHPAMWKIAYVLAVSHVSLMGSGKLWAPRFQQRPSWSACINTPLMTPMTSKPMVTLWAIEKAKYHSLTLSCRILSSGDLEPPLPYQYKSLLNIIDTVDGRNPAPVDRWFIPSFIGFQPSKVVQDFFHPQYYYG